MLPSKYLIKRINVSCRQPPDRMKIDRTELAEQTEEDEKKNLSFTCSIRQTLYSCRNTTCNHQSPSIYCNHRDIKVYHRRIWLHSRICFIVFALLCILYYVPSTVWYVISSTSNRRHGPKQANVYTWIAKKKCNKILRYIEVIKSPWA